MVQIINQISERVWEVNGDWYRFHGVLYPERGFLIKLPNNDFCFVNPIEKNDEVLEQIQ